MLVKRLTIAVLLTLGVGGLAACGSDSGHSSAASSKATSTSAAANATVRLASTSLGMVLVNADGRTLYVFMKDTANASNCTGACAQTWPPLAASGTPTAGDGAKASLLGTIDRADGTKQVTYASHPVYLYAKDSAAQDVNGQGVGGNWFVVDADGQPKR